MRRDLEEAFGIDKITSLENKVHELEKIKHDLESEVKLSQDVQAD